MKKQRRLEIKQEIVPDKPLLMYARLADVIHALTQRIWSIQ